MEYRIPAQDSALQQLARLIQSKCGINYVENTSLLASKINGRVQQLDLSVWEYTERLRTDSAEWTVLVELITINETYFFREEQQLAELSREVMPKLLAGADPVRIWCAACSTGEEPYSIAMTLWEEGGLYPGSVDILGTDINNKVLGIAEKGWYHKNSLCFRRTSPERKNRFFLPEEEGYRVMPEIRNAVRFEEVNLLDEARLRIMEPVDVIFCRNVLIYFDAPTIQRLIRSFYRLLKPGGYLFLGHAETLGLNQDDFTTIHAPSTFYYRKGAC